MRDIKFRAWDKSEQEMIYLDPAECWFEFDADGFHLFYMEQYFETGSGTAVERHCPREEKEVEWLQFSGLEDKNGRDIYEGDILDKKYKYLVIFQNGAFWVQARSAQMHLLTDFLNNRIKALCPSEIVGNKYENPELIEIAILQCAEAKQ